MKVSVVQIGNSRGIRLSKTILEKYQIKDKVELVMESDHIMLRPVTQPRKGWEKAFADMHKCGDDELLIDSVFKDEIWD